MTLNVFCLALVQVYQELLSARRKIGEKSVPCRLGRQKSVCSEDNVFHKRNPIPTSVLKMKHKIKRASFDRPGNRPMCRTGGGVFCESFSCRFIHAADENNKTMMTEIKIHCWVKANSSWTRVVVGASWRGAISWERGNLTQRFSLFAHAVVQFDNVILSLRPQSTAGQDQVIYREWESVKENMHRYSQTDKAARNNRHRDASRWKMAPFLFSRTFLSVFYVVS